MCFAVCAWRWVPCHVCLPMIRGDEVNPNTLDSEDWTLLWLPGSESYERVVKILLKREGVNLHTLDSEDPASPRLTACENLERVVEILLGPAKRCAKMLVLFFWVRSGITFFSFNGLGEEDFWCVFDLLSEGDDFCQEPTCLELCTNQCCILFTFILVI